MTNFFRFKCKSKHGKHFGFLLLLFMFCLESNAQTTVTGVVSDANGPIPGANVILKNSKTGISTNMDGVYSISNVPSNGVLVFSFIGLETKEVAVKGQKTINVKLAESSNSLKEVVIIGYGSSTRSNVTGAISSISGKDLDRIPLPNAAEALRGQVAGVQVTRSSGQPGSNVSIKIRGTKSLGGTSGGNTDSANQAIIVLDGTPILGGNLSEINPDDIESMTILKDAASAAIYGASSSNGVVLITTKKGKAGKSEITVTSSGGISEVANKINFANGMQYVKYLQDAAVGSQIAAGQPISVPAVNSLIGTNELANFLAGKDVSWQDLLLRQGITQNVSLSASGGSDKFHYYVNGDLYDEEGVSVNSDFKRYSYRLNVDYSPTDWLKVGSRVQVSKSFADETSNVISEFNGGGGFAPFLPISNNTPLGTVLNPDGTFTKFIRPDQFQINPLFRYNESAIDRTVSRTIINPYIEAKLGGGFTYTLNGSLETRNEFFGRFLSSNYRDGDPNEATVSKSTNESYMLDNIINYKKDIGKHNITGTFVYGFQKFEDEQLRAFARRLPSDLLGYHGIGDALPIDDDVSWDTDESAKAYLVGRLGYTFDDRYVTTFSVRRDGSSRFAPKNQYGIFPAGSFAWNAHNESFLRESSVVNEMKLRVSYGVTGSDNFPTYFYRASTNNVQIPVGGSEIFNGYGVGSVAANPNLKWEESRQFNVGVDFGFFKNRFTGSLEYYQTNNVDLLLFEQINPVVNSGFDRYPSNVGETKTSGIEVTLKGVAVKTEDFSWVVNANWSRDRNKLVRLSAGDTDANGRPIDNRANGWFIGQDIREIFDYKFLGVWQTAEVDDLNLNNANIFNARPGDPKIADINGDQVINDQDRTFLGNPTPDWYGGITNTFNYKGLELSILVEAVQGVTRINNYYSSFNPGSQLANVININYWTPDNPSNEFPRIGNNGGMMSQFANAIKVRDASFVSLRNISLSYAIPKGLLKKAFIKDLSFSIRGNNLMYFTDYVDAFSPEQGNGSYPVTKTWIFGTKLTF